MLAFKGVEFLSDAKKSFWCDGLGFHVCQSTEGLSDSRSCRRAPVDVAHSCQHSFSVRAQRGCWAV